ncbi:MAG: ACP phosphodiesterase [Crocinitomicaceae bacterium]
MNFLGHAYLSRNYPHLIAGNFAGDSYKGNLNKFDALPKHILDGVRLHRFIDNFTDSSIHIKRAGRILQDKGITKIAFIATDILVDYFLATNWKQYSDQSYDDFLKFVYDNTDPYLDDIDDEFDFLYIRLKKYGWMNDYQTEQGMRKIFRQFSKRIRFENELQQCFEIYLNESETFENHFKTFLIEIEAASVEFIEAL